jgi:SAM-dependent methyltransferase
MTAPHALDDRAPGTLDRWRQKLSTAKRALRDPSFVGSRQLHCPICGYRGLFRWMGDPPRRDAQCPSCRSLERDRVIKVCFDRHPEWIHGGRTLHFAPEPAVTSLVKPNASEYTTADIVQGRADKVLNIEDMQTEGSESYDWIVCSHVLEHIDDGKALRELHRILKPDGLLMLIVPLVEGWAHTFEDPSITTPAGRMRFFGQHDHVRYYGADVRDRITGAGFALREFTAEEPYVSRNGLARGYKLFFATKA